MCGDSEKPSLVQTIDDNWKLITQFRNDFRKAVAERDREAIEYLDLAIQYIRSGTNTGFISFDEWRQNALENPTLALLDRQDRDADSWFFDRFEQLKRESKLSSRELARSTGLSRTTIISISKRRVTPHLDTIKQLASAFGVATNDLLPPKSIYNTNVPHGPE